MAKELCAFCGGKIGVFGGEQILCTGVYQSCCKTCAGEVAGLSQEEICRRALRSGCAAYPERLRAWLTMAQNAEEERPPCRYCGGKLRFRKPVVVYTTTPTGFEEGLATACELQPAFCPECGRIEFFDPAFIRAGETLSYLAKKDTEKP